MRLVALSPLMIAAGCAAFPTLTTRVSEARPTVQEANGPAPGHAPGRRQTTHLERLAVPGAQAAARTARQPISSDEIAALIPDEPVDATVTPQPVAEFVSTVFGGLLNLPYVLGPEVSGRSDLISSGTGAPISKRELMRLSQLALRQYGLEVYLENGLVVIAESETPQAGGMIRGRSTPNSGGNVVQVFPVQTIEVTALQALLRDLFPNAGRARITSDAAANALIISGPAREVSAVARTLRQIDQPRFSGSEVLRVEPVYLAADTLAGSLVTALTAEGYVVSRQPTVPRSILILPLEAANQILVFAESPELLDRVQHWITTLDQPAALGDRQSTFVYAVRNTDAESLGALATGRSGRQARRTAPVGVPGTPPQLEDRQGSLPQAATAAAAPGQFLGGRLIVDSTGNRILFTGTATDYAQLRELLTVLDVPAPQVVIEVIIAEVTLTDGTDLGLEFFGTEVDGDGTYRGGTEAGLGLGNEGLTVRFTGPDLRARFNAAASNSKVNVLSRPRLVARSGGQARFQVGTDVPIITARTAANSLDDGTTDILQSIQYRQTGVILEVQPVIYGDRVDVTISQEISEVGDAISGIDSPTILNRSLTTQMAIRDGWTGVLGGLISNSYTKSNTGVPFLKDVPLIGSAFQSNSVGGTRTELLLLITPIIVRDDETMQVIADQYSQDMSAAFRVGRGWSYTLTPFNLGPIRGLGLDLPSGEPESERPPLFPRWPGRSRVDDNPYAAPEPPPQPPETASSSS